ncbi:MAG: NADH-quinone oxidoreductase subunit N [Candidatus Coatesbacteria bacterium]|nr:MAG: NADH-quinone oxidoreductase subunit N [Candidatus Coatesbacteria bacterium]
MEFNWLSLSPHLILAGGALVLISVAVVGRRFAAAVAPYFTTAVALAAGGAAIWLWQHPATAWFGALTVDPLFVVFAVIFAATLALVALLSTGYGALEGSDRPEYYALLMLVTCAVAFMASATNLVLIYVALEFSSILSYVLVGYLRGDRLSGEAGLKYFLYGAAASAVMLLGFALLYGLTGTTDVGALAERLPRMALRFDTWGHATAVAPTEGLSATLSPVLFFLAFALIMVGLGYKISAVPFHMWAPDAYQGAPTPIAAFLSVASKASGFAVILRLVLALHGPLGLVYAGWTKYLAALAVASMVFAVVVGIVQRDVRRILAYSSIAHAGFALLGIVADTHLGFSSVLVYLVLYAAMNIGAFGVVAALGHVIGGYDLKDYLGLGRRHPVLAAALTVFLLALAGIPPLAGFFAKFYILAALLAQGYIFLAVVAILASVVALFLYARILKPMYFDVPPAEVEKPRRLSFAAAAALLICFVFTLAAGLWPHLLVSWAKAAVVPLLPNI